MLDRLIITFPPGFLYLPINLNVAAVRAFSLKDCRRLFSDILTTPMPCQLRKRKQFVSTVFNEALVAFTHIRPLTVSLWHPLNLEKPFSKLYYH